jgi:hypothetical protein
MFAGERNPDLGEAAAKMLEVIKPVGRGGNQPRCGICNRPPKI